MVECLNSVVCQFWIWTVESWNNQVLAELVNKSALFLSAHKGIVWWQWSAKWLYIWKGLVWVIYTHHQIQGQVTLDDIAQTVGRRCKGDGMDPHCDGGLNGSDRDEMAEFPSCYSISFCYGSSKTFHQWASISSLASQRSLLMAEYCGSYW